MEVMNEWLLICNSAYFDIKKAFSIGDTLTWPQQDELSVGDIVYFYVTNPYKAILYRCKIEELNLRHMDEKVKDCVKHPLFYESAQIYMRLRLIEAYPENLLTDNEIKMHGDINLQKSSKITLNLSDYLAQKSGQNENYNETLTIEEAINGCQKIIILSDGRKLSVNCPPGLKEGQIVRIRHEGRFILIHISISEPIVKDEKSKLGRGIIGAIIGAIIGSVFWILLAQLNVISSFAGLISAFCVFKGYELLGGKIDKKGMVASMIILVVAVYLSLKAGILINIFVSSEYPITFSDFMLTFVGFEMQISSAGYEDMMNSFILNVILSYVFTIIGSYSFIHRISKSGKVSK